MRTSSHKRPRPVDVGRPEGRFTQTRRLDMLRELFATKPQGLTLQAIASALDISERSVRRYLREIDRIRAREKLDELECVETRKGGPLLWRIKPSERTRAVSLRRAQAYALLATRRSLDMLRGSALYDEVTLALTQIASVAQTPFKTSKTHISGERNLEDRFLFVPPPGKSYASRGEELDELFRAVADLRVLRYRPRAAAGHPRAEPIAFHAYAMILHQGAVIVVGAHPERDVEVMRLETMTDIRTSETDHFELPRAFDVESFVHGELGIARPGRARFIVEFDARVSDEVKARRVHPHQRLATAPDGRIRMSIPLVDTRAAVAFVLSWGDAARVIEPPELAAEVGGVLARAAARYE